MAHQKIYYVFPIHLTRKIKYTLFGFDLKNKFVPETEIKYIILNGDDYLRRNMKKYRIIKKKRTDKLNLNNQTYYSKSLRFSINRIHNWIIKNLEGFNYPPERNIKKYRIIKKKRTDKLNLNNQTYS